MRFSLGRLLFSGLWLTVCATGAAASAPLTQPLQDALLASEPDSRIAILAVLDPDAIGPPPKVLRAGVPPPVWWLELRSQSAAGPVLEALHAARAKGLAERIELLWVAHVVRADVDRSLIAALSAVPGVVYLALDTPLPPDTHGDGDQSGPNLSGTINLPLRDLNVDDVWAMGYTGKNVVIAHVDTGAFRTHPDLSDHIWVNADEIPGNSLDDDNNGFIDDVRGWDFRFNDNDPGDWDGHGTLTAGISVGDGHQGTQTGVAPDAELMILARGLTESTIWSCIQYAINNGADLIQQATTFGWADSPRPNYPQWRTVGDSELAAGLIHINSAGNRGGLTGSHPVPYNVGAPANNPPPWRQSAQTLMGGLSSTLAVANIPVGGTVISGTSAVGPSEWTDIQANVDPTYPYTMPLPYRDYPYLGGTQQGLLKPDVTAYGDGTPSTQAGGGYGTLNGTSASSAHVAGIVALLLEVEPSASPARLARALFDTAHDRGPVGWDTRYGIGQVDAKAAVDWLLDPCAPNGGDADGDGICQNVDNCPSAANPSQADLDGDGSGDACDPDDDGDTVADGSDNCPTVANTDQANADGDAFGNACDVCPLDPLNDQDGDAICGNVDNCPALANPAQADLDGDGSGDACDPDDDGDTVGDGSDNCPGVANTDQANADGDAFGNACDICPLDPLNDQDADAVCGNVDNCPTIANTDQTNDDADPLGNACDCAPNNGGVFAPPARVGDSLVFAADRVTLSWGPQADAERYNVYKGRIGGSEGFYRHTCHQLDLTTATSTDSIVPAAGQVFYYLVSAESCFGESDLGPRSNGTARPGPDACGDDDADGLRNTVDNCPVDFNPLQQDADQDAKGDVCDICPFAESDDADNDGVCGDVDNCPVTANPSQADLELDGTGDVCDPDDDNDGALDVTDNCPLIANSGQANDDGDALGNACDACPLDAANDQDGDTLCGNVDNCPSVANLDQANADGDVLGNVCDSCPLDALNDQDGDTLCGNIDNCPSVANLDQADLDLDGTGDLCDLDDDGDGVTDLLDNCARLLNPDQLDGDGDQLGDLCDLCPVDPLNDGDADGACANVDNCPQIANPGQANSDADALGDACDCAPNDGAVFAPAARLGASVQIAPDHTTLTWSAQADAQAWDLYKGRIRSAAEFYRHTCHQLGLTTPAGSDSTIPAAGEVFYYVVAARNCAGASDLGVTSSGSIRPPSDGCPDGDTDGIRDLVDNCPGTGNLDQADDDRDAYGNVCDSCPVDPLNDQDGDTRCANLDNCPSVANLDQANSDGDSFGNACDICPADALNDQDGDTRCANLDNCPSVANLDQANDDGDSFGNACDICPSDALNDQDGDSRCANVDNCPTVANLDQADLDADLLGDLCDPCPIDPLNDNDADGACGNVDNCQNLANPGQANLDADPLGDACDCAPNDGAVFAPPATLGASVRFSADRVTLTWTDLPAAQTYDVFKGRVRSGAEFYRHTCHQLDSPTPSVSDTTIPAAGEVFYYLVETENCYGRGGLGTASNGTTRPGADACPDADGDGVRNLVDNCPGIANASQIDTDRDGTGDACETLLDTDGDGVLDANDNCPTVPNPTQRDTNHDGQGDACEDLTGDADNDTVPDQIDNCPSVANLDQGDLDGDDSGDVCDPDKDGDTVLDGSDNCPLIANLDQADLDGDNTGDLCDPDLDGDTIANGLDNCLRVANTSQLDFDGDDSGDACESDDDGDGAPEPGDNCALTFNPSQADTDLDGTGNECESDGRPAIAMAKRTHAFGTWLTMTPYEGTLTLLQTRWRISTADGAGFDGGVFWDVTQNVAPLTEIRALYGAARTTGTLYARVRYQDAGGTSLESESFPFSATALPADTGSLGAHAGVVEFADSFDGPDIATNRADNLDRGGAFWPATLSEASVSGGRYLLVRARGAEHPLLGTQARAQSGLLVSQADSFVEASVTPASAAAIYDFAIGVRSTGTLTTHRSYRCKIERQTGGRDTIRFNKWYDGVKGTTVGSVDVTMPSAPWKVRCEASTEGGSVRLRAYLWTGGGWQLQTEFLDSGSSGQPSWDSTPRILAAGRALISHEKEGPGRFEDVRAGRLLP